MPEEEDNKKMSFLSHLEVFRWHLVRSIVAILVVTVVAFVAKDFVFNYLIFPPSKGDFWSYQQMCLLATQLGFDSDLCQMKLPFKIISTKMSGQFSMHLWVSVVIGFIVAFPYIFWEMWRFISPGLTLNERKKSKIIVGSTSFLFALGVLFGYFIVAPLSILFLGTYQVSDLVENTFHLSSYIGIITSVLLSCGILFQIPIVIYFLTSLGLISTQFLKKYRRHAIVVIFLLGAIITPPDVGSQILISIPIILLYQIGIFIAKRVEKRTLKNS